MKLVGKAFGVAPLQDICKGSIAEYESHIITNRLLLPGSSLSGMP
jgi:hypothetical protein